MTAMKPVSKNNTVLPPKRGTRSMEPNQSVLMSLRNRRIALFLTATALLAIGTLYPSNTVSYERTEANSPVSREPINPTHIPYVLPAKVVRILTDLIRCESHGNEHALNAVDRDGTASYGLLQFKPDTLYMVVKQYGLMPDIERDEIMNVMYDGDLQVRAFVAWYGDGKPVSWWQQQFPACSLRYGYWLD